jgi:hypothetical protein
MRGFFVWNSEVGAGAIRAQTFLLENVCGNHIVWGASQVRSFRTVHRGDGAIGTFRDRLGKQLRDLSRLDTSAEVGMLTAARKFVLGKNREEVVEFATNAKNLGLSKTDAEAAFTWSERWEHTALAPPNTAWGYAHGLTRYSQSPEVSHGYADARSSLDAAGGKLLAMVAAKDGVDVKRLALPSPN